MCSVYSSHGWYSVSFLFPRCLALCNALPFLSTSLFKHGFLLSQLHTVIWSLYSARFLQSFSFKLLQFIAFCIPCLVVFGSSSSCPSLWGSEFSWQSVGTHPRCHLWFPHIWSSLRVLIGSSVSNISFPLLLPSASYALLLPSTDGYTFYYGVEYFDFSISARYSIQLVRDLVPLPNSTFYFWLTWALTCYFPYYMLMMLKASSSLIAACLDVVYSNNPLVVILDQPLALIFSEVLPVLMFLPSPFLEALYHSWSPTPSLPFSSSFLGVGGIFVSSSSGGLWLRHCSVKFDSSSSSVLFLISDLITA